MIFSIFSKCYVCYNLKKALTVFCQGLCTLRWVCGVMLLLTGCWH